MEYAKEGFDIFMSHIDGNATYICIMFEYEQESCKNTYTFISNTLVNWDMTGASISKYICVPYLYKICISQYFVICSFLFALIRNLIGVRLDSLVS